MELVNFFYLLICTSVCSSMHLPPHYAWSSVNVNTNDIELHCLRHVHLISSGSNSSVSMLVLKEAKFHNIIILQCIAKKGKRNIKKTKT